MSQRGHAADRLGRLERQMSGRNRMLKIKEWEIAGLRVFCESLRAGLPEAARMRFFYSFSLPKLGKEFDLLRIDDRTVVNVELKSGNVSDEVIRKQLLQNRYYLSMLDRNMHFFTFVSSTGTLKRLSNAGRLLDASWDQLIRVLCAQEKCFDGDIESLFQENQYLISPITDPGRFLRRDYFLTSQQRDIREKILKSCRRGSERPDDAPPVMGFTGLPGTGKTILLYDLAMELSASRHVCMFYFGGHPRGIEKLNDRLKRVDFYYCDTDEPPVVSRSYAAVFIDEGHRIPEDTLAVLYGYAVSWHAPVIVSYDSEVPIAVEEQKYHGTDRLKMLPGFTGYKLTNRIRLNRELSVFIQCVMRVKGRNHRREYPNVSLVYANARSEAGILLDSFREEGYQYIRDPMVDQDLSSDTSRLASSSGQDPVIEIHEATSREFDRVVMMMDDSFVYDDEGYLRSAGLCKKQASQLRGGGGSPSVETVSDGRVRHLYHGLNRAKRKIAIIVIGNLEVFDRLLGILQRP